MLSFGLTCGVALFIVTCWFASVCAGSPDRAVLEAGKNINHTEEAMIKMGFDCANSEIMYLPK